MTLLQSSHSGVWSLMMVLIQLNALGLPYIVMLLDSLCSSEDDLSILVWKMVAAAAAKSPFMAVCIHP